MEKGRWQRGTAADHAVRTPGSRRTLVLPLTIRRLCCRHESNVSTYRSFMRYVVAMAVVPAITMFVMYNFVLDHLFTFGNNGDRMAYAGVAAILSVQCVIAKFLFFAFSEDPKTGEQNQAPAKSKST